MAFQDWMTLSIIIVSAIFLVASLVYFYGMDKGEHDDEIFAGIALIIYGILGAAVLWMINYRNRGNASTMGYIAMLGYAVVPIGWGMYIFIKHLKAKQEKFGY